MTIVRHSLVAAAFVGCATLSAPAFAAMTWGFQQPGVCSQNAGNANNYGNSWACGGGNPALTVSGYSSNGAGSTFVSAFTDDNGGSGFGVKSSSEGLNATSPQHAMDNNGSTDVLLLSFTSSVILRQLQLGWWSTDSDVTLLRYTGSTSPLANSDLTGLTTAQLLSNGWSLVGNYGTLDTTMSNVNAGSASSSWWLLSAYNSTLAGSTASANGRNLSAGDDYVKVLAVVADAVTPPPVGRVPEPASLALAGLALAGVVAARRRTAGGNAALPRLAAA
ncbi:exosortase-dependent surface protein XDP1 [Aquincola tertiaricarbonis]|uniref:exosortase-dependent surface protein XDP1 n=1 Tax=Aquincola tertiaricarbonis TaxID=391953 RepID=UPI0012ED79B9|nr:exosortase-dependent surface protein XDP1 [Aquincola tertiaricarbonis]